MTNRCTSQPHFLRLSATIISAAVLLIACGPTSGPSGGPSAGSDAKAPAGPKILTIGERDEPTTIVLYGRLGEGGTPTGRYERFFIFHTNLTSFDAQGNVLPRAAAKVPTVQDGDWKVDPDGAMQVTWKLREDVYWQDGTRLTADDFAFGFDIIKDPKLGISGLGEIAKVAAVEALDPKTILVTWKSLSLQGNVNSVEGIPAIPKHLLGEPYRTMDPLAFASSPAWRSEFVGLGPYRVLKFEAGSHIEAEAFGQYFLGRPKIDRLVIRWSSDTQVMVAQLLAGSMDYIARGASLFPDQMVEIQRQWGPNGGRVFAIPNDIRVLWLNARVDGQPWDPAQAGWQRDVRFRRAMLYSMNRQRLADDLQYGFTPVVYFPAFLDFPVYKLALQRGIPKYEFDPVKGQQLFAEAGWSKGPDGLLRNSGGQVVHFPCCNYSVALGSDVQESLGWGVDLQAAGIEVENPIPSPQGAGLSASELRKAQTVGWGGRISNWTVVADANFGNLIKANIAREETGWTGTNSGAWTNPSYDSLYAKAQSTIDPAGRLETEFQMVKLIMDELPMLPVYHTPTGAAVRKGLEGPGTGSPFNRGNMADIHLWDITS